MAAQPDDFRNRSLEERVSRLEGGSEHLATKADIERVLAELERVRTESQVANERNRAEFQIGLERNRAEIERNRAEGERNRADIIKIMVRLAGVGMALMALGFAFLRFTGTA